MSGQGRSPLQTNETGTRALESLLGFWAEAGVDTAFADEPVDRIAERPRPLPTAARARVSPATAAGPDVSGAIAEARRLAAGAEDLPALAAAIAAFDGCGLKFEGARQAVFSRGVADAPVMVIGEAPGGEEDAVGAPFVGRAGKLLDLMLRAAGLDDRVFVTNTVFWRPSGNRNPTPQEQLVCAPFLERAIALVQPRFLLLAGGYPPRPCCSGRRASWRCAAAGSTGLRRTARSPCPRCQPCTRPSCCANRPPRNAPGPTF